MHPLEWIYHKEPLLYKVVEIVTPRLAGRIWEEAWKERKRLSGSQRWISTLASPVIIYWWITDEQQNASRRLVPRSSWGYRRVISMKKKSQIIPASSCTSKAWARLKMQERMHTVYNTEKHHRQPPQLSNFQKKQGQKPLKEISLLQCLSNCEIVLNLSESVCISKRLTLDP